jgi:hypothetical protein
MWGALSDETTGLPFAVATGPRQRSHSRVKVRGARDPILESPIRDSPIRRLLRLAVLRWRYSTPPPHGIASSCQNKILSYVTSDGQSTSLVLVPSTHLGLTTRLLLLSDSFGFC